MYKGLSDFFTLMASSIVVFGQKPLYLNIEELNSAQQQAPGLNRPSFSLKSFIEPQNQSFENSKKRLGEEPEQNEPQPSPWIKEEDCINLGKIKEIKESHWAYRAIKEEKVGDKKRITIEGSELVDFFRTALATFGTFRVQMEDDLLHYFFIYFSIV